MPNLPVDKFFGIACPGSSNLNTSFVELVRRVPMSTHINQLNGDYAMRKINESKRKHVGKINYLNRLVEFGGDPLSYIGFVKSLFEDGKISKNLMHFYNDLAINEDTNLDVSTLNVKKLYLFNGFQTDLVVHYQEGQDIIDDSVLINSKDKELKTYDGFLSFENHGSIKSNNNVKKDINDKLEG